ncbi:hypothetical protein BGC07_14810 [Piscirickettsia litoralis]|uniref:Uncharacterized protein n=1 Tax=Piscirickettsia litoralis TaxID=1891921 RepID=A0ABX3A4Y6_9GAMM|nr:hypothetical protein BGC07_14810 [Piscirickettsia litoralis]
MEKIIQIIALVLIVLRIKCTDFLCYFLVKIYSYIKFIYIFNIFILYCYLEKVLFADKKGGRTLFTKLVLLSLFRKMK